jgi:DDE superfamily endonuclease
VLERLEFHYVPKHASWLNMVEIEIGVLRGQCLDRRIGTRQRLASEIAAWERLRNAVRSRIKWMFTIEKARTKMDRPILATLTPGAPKSKSHSHCAGIVGEGPRRAIVNRKSLWTAILRPTAGSAPPRSSVTPRAIAPSSSSRPCGRIVTASTFAARPRSLSKHILPSDRPMWAPIVCPALGRAAKPGMRRSIPACSCGRVRNFGSTQRSIKEWVWARRTGWQAFRAPSPTSSASTILTHGCNARSSGRPSISEAPPKR